MARKLGKVGTFGDQVTLSNGAVANVVGGTYKDNKANRAKGRVGKEYQRLQITRGGNPPANRARKSISPEQAKRAFTSYWNKRYRTASPEKKRGVKSAWARDLAYGNPKGLRSTTSYRRSPGRLDYEGVDFGAKRYKAVSSAKRTAALKAGRATERIYRDTAANREKGRVGQRYTIAQK